MKKLTVMETGGRNISSCKERESGHWVGQGEMRAYGSVKI